MKKVLFSFFVLSFSITYSQQGVSALGVTIEVPGAMTGISITIGEPIYSKSIPGFPYELSEGIQQVFYWPIGFDEFNTGKWRIKTYPNPATDLLKIEINNVEENKIEVSLIDITGRLILEQSIKDSSTNLDLSNLSNGTYILRAKDEYNRYQEVRIIKI